MDIGNHMHQAARQWDRDRVRALQVLEGYAWSLGIMTEAWDKDELADEFTANNQWDEILARL